MPDSAVDDQIGGERREAQGGSRPLFSPHQLIRIADEPGGASTANRPRACRRRAPDGGNVRPPNALA